MNLLTSPIKACVRFSQNERFWFPNHRWFFSSWPLSRFNRLRTRIPYLCPSQRSSVLRDGSSISNGHHSRHSIFDNVVTPRIWAPRSVTLTASGVLGFKTAPFTSCTPERSKKSTSPLVLILLLRSCGYLAVEQHHGKGYLVWNLGYLDVSGGSHHGMLFLGGDRSMVLTVSQCF